ncbi:MAG: hypothetical protein IJS14_09455 [Lentisphaeria bacterium]|nr:hypothetical protein [Lentisphaeria bacterium]
MTLSADPEIRRILREPEGDTPQDHLELLSVLSNRITPAGIACPPPTLGTYALLCCIRSPFSVPHPRGKIRREDAAAALFILARPKQAAELLRQRAECEAKFARTEESGDAGPDLRETLAEERNFRKEWNREIHRFGRRMGRGNRALRRTADELARYLDPGIGFSMLPESDGSDPQAFNLETVARIAAGLADVMPGITPDQALWQIPMPAIGMLLVQSARKHGIRGISRDEKSRQLWQRFRELQDPEGKNLRPKVRKRGGPEAKASRHYQLIRTAADLHPAPAQPRREKAGRTIFTRNGTVIGKTETTAKHVSRTAPAVSGQETIPHADRTRQEKISGISRDIGLPRDAVTVSGNGDRRSWPGQTGLAGTVLPTGAGPLQTLANSVANIENLLKNRLPDSVV